MFQKLVATAFLLTLLRVTEAEDVDVSKLREILEAAEKSSSDNGNSAGNRNTLHRLLGDMKGDDFRASAVEELNELRGPSLPETHGRDISDQEALLLEMRHRVEFLETTLAAVTRQVMLQELASEEKTRLTGDSGLLKTRMQKIGTKPYYAASFVDSTKIASIHNHANNIRTVGMGELGASLNGVVFRTRHNDYRLNMPSRTSTDYNAIDEIPFPEVPPAVKNKATVKEEIEEMKEWFKAFKQQNHTVRDYRPYFKPILCYLEGAWTTETRNLDEPFDSDRHFLRAEDWFDLQEKIRFMAYTGRKDANENLAYLPTTIIKTLDGFPEFAQWNYRILCHPIQKDIPLSHFRLVDDLQHRLAADLQYDEVDELSRGARFQLGHRLDTPFLEQEKERFGMAIDKLMSEIPGKDNYKGELTDTLEGYTIKNYFGSAKLNAAYYHRPYKMSVTDAMGLSRQSRGFNDQSIYMAMTSHPEVSSMVYEECKPKATSCTTVEQRWTYAIPLEIIYLTPLQSWNPYNLEYKGDVRYNKKQTNTVAANGRSGALTPDKAFNGTHSKLYYHTPLEFFMGGEIDADPADTTADYFGVLDPEGNVQKVAASGVRIHLPDIPGVGIIRQRYPIPPVHEEGSVIWKELQALKDVVLEPSKFGRYKREDAGTTTPVSTPDPAANDPVMLLKTGVATVSGAHSHTVELTRENLDSLLAGEKVDKTTSIANSHEHNLQLWFEPVAVKFYMTRCDGQLTCLDGHPHELTIVLGKDLLPSADPIGAVLLLRTSTVSFYPPHTHKVKLDTTQLNDLITKGSTSVTTEAFEGHEHDLQLYYNAKAHSVSVALCGDEAPVDNKVCWDQHPKYLGFVAYVYSEK